MIAQAGILNQKPSVPPCLNDIYRIVICYTTKNSNKTFPDLTINEFHMMPSLLRIGLLCIGCIFLTSCVVASNWLSGPTQQQTPQFDASIQTPPLQIGVTTKEEIVSRLGDPTHRHIHSIDGIQFESLSYSHSPIAITPFQYIPLFGAIAFLRPFTDEIPPAAISFSSDQRVSGLTASTVNAYGDIDLLETFPVSNSPTFYGMRNPEVFHSRVVSTP